MTELNANAKEFYPKWAKEEDELFDTLEKKFVEKNPWIFKCYDDEEYKSEWLFNKKVRECQSSEKKSSKKTYAEAIKE